MKKNLFWICIIALLATACKPDPEPGVDPNGGGTNDTTETIIKKYLVKEYYKGFPNEPLMEIEWDVDFTKITHITTYKDNPYQLDFSFEYYGDDSMRVVLSKPTDSWAFVFFTDYTCHFDTIGRITNIDFFVNSEYQSSQKYNYDPSGRLVSIVDEEHNNQGVQFVWDGDNVCEINAIPSGETLYTFSAFTDFYHPYYTMPYLLSRGDGYHSMFLTKPLWKNWYTNNSYGTRYEIDEDGYVNYAYFITEDGDTTSQTCYKYSR